MTDTDIEALRISATEALESQNRARDWLAGYLSYWQPSVALTLLTELAAARDTIERVLSDERAAVLKARVYGEQAYKWRRCVDAGLASEEDRVLADEWQERDVELAAARAELAALRGVGSTVRTCRYYGHSPAQYSEGQCQQCGEPSK